MKAAPALVVVTLNPIFDPFIVAQLNAAAFRVFAENGLNTSMEGTISGKHLKIFVESNSQGLAEKFRIVMSVQDKIVVVKDVREPNPRPDTTQRVNKLLMRLP